MRIGNNPNKNEPISKSSYLHQIIIPVYIPNQEGFFRDSFAILQLCLESLFATTHNKTFITIVSNGSNIVVSNYLDILLKENKIQELIHTENIGKVNAIIKGLAGNNIEFVTISDSDVQFLPNWQNETLKVFGTVPKAGVVGIVPQFKTYESDCGNVLFDTLFSSKLQFMPVQNKEALVHFYDSIGWDRNYNHDYLEYALGLKINAELNVLIGSGHFVATYKKDIFENITTYIGYKMGGDSERYMDRLTLKKDYWRLTTQNNYAYHMGNVLEDWMKDASKAEKVEYPIKNVSCFKRKEINKFCFFFKNRLFVKFLSSRILVKLFLRWKKLPKAMIENY